jgi:HlyD family secretion protein
MKKKSSSKKYWLILLALVVIGGVAYLIVNNNMKKQASLADLQTTNVSRGELVAIVGATGTVHANQSAVLTWQTSGRISEINVAVGETVASEEILARLLDATLPQSVILARADLVTAERNLENLRNSGVARAQAQLTLANAKDAYDRAVWSNPQGNTARTTDQNKIDAARAAVTLAENRVNDAEEAYDRVKSRDDSDPLKAAALSTLANARESLQRAKQDLNYLIQTPTEKELAISDAKVAVALAQYEDALREWERVKDGADPDDIAAAEARITALNATINLARLIAPFSGTVTDVNAMVGDLVNAGTQAFRIDDLSHLLVDVQIPEVDINSIKAGQQVDLTFDAILNKAYQGRVISVANSGTVQSGLVTFKVTIEILNPDEQVRPGMTAAVNIVINQLENVLTVPNRAVRLVDGETVVYLLKNNAVQKAPIKIGASSDTVSEVISGDLKEGDKVILNPPSSIMDIDFQGGPPF